jgi:hypothetical protein
MSLWNSRGIADWLLRSLAGLAPDRMSDWAEAVRAEAASIDDDGEALRFAAETGGGLALTFLWARLGDALALSPDGAEPRLAAAFAATVAVAIGVAHLCVAGAPFSMIVVNIASLVIGLAMLAGATRWHLLSRDSHDPSMVIMAGLLVLTSMFGISSQGAARWVAIGSLMVQPSLILLPALLIMFVRNRTGAGVAAIIVAAVAMALQSDRAMAGAMFSGMAVLWIWHRNGQVAVALAATGTSFLITLARTDSMLPARFTEGVLISSWQSHPLIGIAVALGAAMLLLPCAVSRGNRNIASETSSVFGAIWLAIILAAILGDYPAPLVGYGGSAIIGYLLSACMLPPKQPLHRMLPTHPKPVQARPTNLARLSPRRTSCA